MKEELKHELQAIINYYYTGSAMPDIIILNAMETAYRHGYMDAMQEMSKDSDTQEQYDKHQNPCDKVSHDCHIEYDTLSHGSCFDCVHCEHGQELDGSESLFCHHDDVRDGKELPVSDCPLWEKDDGSVPC